MTGGPHDAARLQANRVEDQDQVTIRLADRVTTVSHVSAVEIDGETVVYDCRTEQLHLLNPVATMVWWQLDGAEPLSRLCDQLGEAFHEPVTRIRADVLALVGRLLTAGLVDRIDGP